MKQRHQEARLTHRKGRALTESQRKVALMELDEAMGELTEDYARECAEICERMRSTPL